MKKFISKLLDECQNYTEIPDLYFNESDMPCLDNYYSKAILNEFEGTVVPTRNSELEDLALCVAECIEVWNGGSDYYDEVCLDENSIKFYDALCHCLIRIDYESARYNYDYHSEVSLNHFYLICNEYGINYNRVSYAFKYDPVLSALVNCGFRKSYLNAMGKDIPLKQNSFMTYCDEVLLNKEVDLKCRKHVIEDWLSNPIIKKFWDKIPDEYIREHYRDSDFYHKLEQEKKLALFAMYIDAVRLEVNELDSNVKFNLSDIERSLKRPRFINGKLLSAYKLSGLKDGNSDFEQKCEWFISRSAGLSALVYVFPSYKDVIKKAIIAASKK